MLNHIKIGGAIIKNIFREPTRDECNENTKIYQNEKEVAYALWFPNMGGYAGKAIAVFSMEKPIEKDDCMEIYVWHNGDFPFCGSEKPPAKLHICDPTDFINLGTTLMAFQMMREKLK